MDLMQKSALKAVLGGVILGYSLMVGGGNSVAQPASVPFAELDPSRSTEEQLQQATILQSQGDFEGAIAIYEAVAQQSPLNRQASEALALLYAYIQDYDTSIEKFQALLTLYPDDLSLQLQLARVTGWSGDFELAAQRYNQILASNITSDRQRLEARLGLAEVLGWDQQYTESLAVYATILQQTPDNLDAQLGQAEVQLWAGRTQAAIAYYQAIVQRSPDSSAARLGLARAYQAVGRPTAALTALDPLLEGRHPEALAIQQEILAVWAETRWQSIHATNGEASQSVQQTVQFPIANTDLRSTVRLEVANFEQSGFESRQNYLVEVGGEGRLESVTLRAALGADFFNQGEPSARLHATAELPIAPDLMLGTHLRYAADKTNVQTLENQITAAHLEPTLYWQLDRLTTLYLAYALGLYSDGNTEHQSLLELRREWGDFYLAGTLLYWSYANDPQNGYFAPPDYFLYRGEVGWKRQLFQPLTCQLAAALGQQQYETTNENNYRLQAGCTVDFSPALQVELNYRLTNNDRLQASGDALSTQQTIQGRLQYSF
jgi:tetratricopeptide (TPR) repeat protein